MCKRCVDWFLSPRHSMWVIAWLDVIYEKDTYREDWVQHFEELTLEKETIRAHRKYYNIYGIPRKTMLASQRTVPLWRCSGDAHLLPFYSITEQSDVSSAKCNLAFMHAQPHTWVSPQKTLVSLRVKKRFHFQAKAMVFPRFDHLPQKAKMDTGSSFNDASPLRG